MLLACLAAGGVLAVRALSAGSGRHTGRVTSLAAPSAALLPDGSAAKFRFLARQTSNRCDLEPGALPAMPDAARLQGACCSPMDLTAYRSQVRGLRAYRRMSEIPRDPYDISVALAKRLLRFDRTIQLSRAQVRRYSRAMRMSDEKGPCCCPCWRWDAFRGLSKHLLADRRWRPARLARVIDLLEGCGGRA